MCVSAGISLLFNQVRYEHPHHEKSNCILQLLFSVIFALRRVILLRSDIRLSAERYLLRKCEGEYNITVSKANNITFTYG